MNTQSRKELEEQTVKAYAAWRKDTSTKIQYQSILGVWHDCAGDPCWLQSESYRIKPEPPKPLEVEVWWHPSRRIADNINDSDPAEQPFMLAAGFVRATATIKVKEGE